MSAQDAVAAGDAPAPGPVTTAADTADGADVPDAATASDAAFVPAQANPAAGPAPDAWVRLSPRALAVRPITDLLRSAPILVGVLFAGGGHENYWGLGFAVFAVLMGIWRWCGTKYQLTETRLYVRRGLLAPKVLSTPRASVRSVDRTAHVLYRLLGLTVVKVGTGRNDKREGDNFKLDAVLVADADALRAQLLTPQNAAAASGVSGASAADDAGSVERGRETELVRLHPSWIRFAPLTLTGLVILGVLAGFLSQAQHDSGINVTSLGPVHDTSHWYAALPLAEAIPVGALGILVTLAVVSILGYIAVFWRFRLVRSGDGALHVTRGLLSTRSTTIDAARVRGVEISEPLSLRAANGARCLAITTGLRVGGGAERGGSILLPPAPRPVAHRLAAEILGVPEDLCTGALAEHGPAAHRRRYTRVTVAVVVFFLALTLLLVAVSARAPFWPLIALPPVLALGLPVARDRYRGLGHRLAEDGWIVVSGGSLVRRRSILSVRGVIGWNLRQSWFQRRKGLVSVLATTAAGKQKYAAQDVPLAEALAFISAATPDLVTPFLAAQGAAAA